MTKGRIIGVISIKGGVGKTTTVSNLGAVLANEFGKKVLLVDANYSAPNLGLHLGIVNPDKTLHDVMRDTVLVSQAIHPHELGFHVLPASLSGRRLNAFKLKEKISGLKNNYDIILIDSSPNLNEEMLSTMLASDELLVGDHCVAELVETANHRGGREVGEWISCCVPDLAKAVANRRRAEKWKHEVARISPTPPAERLSEVLA